MIALLLRLYPARWRARYGDEFAALLEERPLGPFDVADVLLGAIDAHLHLRGLGSWSEHRKGFPMSLRIGGFAATIGGALWFAGLLWGTLDRADEDPGAAVMFLGTVALLVGIAGLSAFQARRHPQLVWVAFALPALGGAMLAFGLLIMAAVGEQPVLGGLYGWGLFIMGLLATLAGSALFAVATYRTAALPRSGAITLGVTSAVSVVTFVVASTLKESGPPALMLGLGAFALGWVVLGLQALRADRPALAASPA